ncbi:uncharacterized protein LOC124698859 isoform X2 [Lolium rigidum]|uniref:uncharacterized protein LOC124698859 isoform X2 n=1 Tax=Lolium rigidum TaxID=89674 RepID=UPI001F5D24A6|nr:uncharacterized protein LOC124698859 isoform X2 [Lolium rigidum]
MGRTSKPSALVLLSLHAIAAVLLLLPSGARAEGECGKVKCGMGSCDESSDYAFGFACQCNPGWSRNHLGDMEFPFLPCVIPNCTIKSSCQNESPPAPSLLPPAAMTNLSVYDPCLLQYCGGGNCEKTGFTYRCACRDGFKNFFDNETFPCYRQCSLGTDCSSLGIGILNGSNTSTSPPAPVSFALQKSSAPGGWAPAAHRLPEIIMLVAIFLVHTIL